MRRKEQNNLLTVVRDFLWGMTHRVEHIKRNGTMGRMDFLNHISEYRKTHPELSSLSDMDLLNAWQNGRFNFNRR